MTLLYRPNHLYRGLLESIGLVIARPGPSNCSRHAFRGGQEEELVRERNNLAFGNQASDSWPGGPILKVYPPIPIPADFPPWHRAL